MILRFQKIFYGKEVNFGSKMLLKVVKSDLSSGPKRFRLKTKI